MGFARGKHAVAICQRSGKKIPYKKLVRDGYNPSLLVAADEADIEHPAEKPIRITESIALSNPSPDLDQDVTVSESLVDSLFPNQPVFGGNT